MPVALLEKLLGEKPAVKALLGLDIGKKTIGVAVSDPGQSLATPLETVRRRKFADDMAALGKIVMDYDIGGFVIGWPVNMDGSAGPRCDAVRSFADEMKNYPQAVGKNPWIALWDERLSTRTVEDFVGKHVDINKAKRDGTIDRLAAQVILQGALDYMGRNQP